MGLLKYKTIFITDNRDQTLAVLDNKVGESCPYIEPDHTEELNGETMFEFQIPTNHPDAEFIQEQNMVKFWDENDNFQEFVIQEVIEEHSDDLIKTAVCEHLFFENVDHIVKDQRPVDKTAEEVLDGLLADTIGTTPRWTKGIVDSLGTGSPPNIYHESLVSGINKILTEYKAERRFRTILDSAGNESQRLIDILSRRGSDTGRRFEYTKDIEKIERHVDSHGVKTALIGRGKGEESGDGYGRRITFENVEWSTANGDPVDKPLGQSWVGDPDALQEFGRENDQGQSEHRMGKSNHPDETDPAVLLQKTWDELQERNKPIASYKATAIDLGTLLDIDHEKIQLGDTVFVIDHEFKPALILETRIVKIKRRKGEPEQSDITFGNFIPLFTDDDGRVDQIEETINQNRGQWESDTVNDTNFPDDVPPVPANVTIEGLFQNVRLLWDYDPSYYIASYEVYASQVAKFTPDSSNLVWKGKSGGYLHKADTNQQWYFKLRAVNTHGTASAFTSEFSAQTAQIAGVDVADEIITNRMLAKTAILDSIHVGQSIIQDGHFDRATANRIKIQDADIVNIKAETVVGGSFAGEIFTGGRFEGQVFDAGEIYGSYIEGSEFVATFQSSDNYYGDLNIQNNRVKITRGYTSGDPNNRNYDNYELTTTVDELEHRILWEQFGIGQREFYINRWGAFWDGYGGSSLEQSGNMNGNFSIEVGDFDGANNMDTYLKSSNGQIVVRPYNLLDVWVNSNPASGGPIMLVKSSGNSERLRVEHNGAVSTTNNTFKIGTDSTGGTGGTSLIGENGRLGINRSPTYPLDVDGDIRALGGRVIVSNYVLTSEIQSSGYYKLVAGGNIDHFSDYETRIRNSGGTGYTGIVASDFITGSEESKKQDIELATVSALDLITQSDLYNYRLISEVEKNIDKIHLGLIIGEGYNTPKEVINHLGEGISQYDMNSYSWKGIQETNIKFDDKIAKLEQRVAELESQMSA